MQPVFAYSASALATLWLVVHFVLGGREVAGPLRHNAQIPNVVRVTAWMCWHMVTGCIALLAALPILAITLEMPGLMVASILMSLVLAVAGIVAQAVLRAGFKTLPQGWLFLPVALLAWWAL